MNPLTIKEQVKLPLRRCLALTLNGLHHRLFRASVTVSIVTLAVAFLAAMAGETMISRNIAKSLSVMTKPRRLFLFWTDILTQPMETRQTVELLSSAQPGTKLYEMLNKWGGGDVCDMALLAKLAKQETQYVRFFDGLEEGVLRTFAGRLRGRDLLKEIDQPEHWGPFSQAVADGVLIIPGTIDDFEDFLPPWQQTEALRQKINAGQHASSEHLKIALGQTTLQEALAGEDPLLSDKILHAGFLIPPDEYAALKDGALFAQRLQRLERLLSNTKIRQRFALQFEIKEMRNLTSERFYRALGTKKGSEWLAAQLRDLELETALNGTNIRETALGRQMQERLATVEGALGNRATSGEKTFLSLPPRIVALIIVSLLVCTVGIVNAMLMSVTERFKEIATMKCLGATDGVVMSKFVLEAGFQGVVGGCIGTLIGILLGVLRSLWGYGTIAVKNIPWDTLTGSFGVIVMIGIGLSIVAAIYPAWMAARLSPMEAMRVE